MKKEANNNKKEVKHTPFIISNARLDDLNKEIEKKKNNQPFNRTKLTKGLVDIFKYLNYIERKKERNHKMKKEKILKSLIIVSTGVVMFSSVYGANKTINKIINVTTEDNIRNKIENQITIDKVKYNLSTYKLKNIEPEKIEKTYKSETKILNSDNESFLKSQFNSNYNYEDEKYKGELNLKDFNIEIIPGNKYEEIDQKTIVKNGLNKYNDLDKISKTTIINGTTYYLIDTNWIEEENKVIDNTEVPKTYRATSFYRAVLKKQEPNKYKVSANYKGIITEKQRKQNLQIDYIEEQKAEVKKEKKNNVPQIVIGFFAMIIAILGFLMRKNAKIILINKDEEKTLKKLRIKDNSMIDISNFNITDNDNLVLSIKEKDLYKLKGKKITMKRFNKTKTITILNKNNPFVL